MYINRGFLRLIATVLSLGILLSVPPTQLYAEIVGVTQTTDTTGEEANASVVGELSELRSDYIKYFTMDDGSITAAVYSSAIHYEGSNGEYLDVDNSLVLQENAYGDMVYRNVLNSYSMMLPQTTSSQKMIEFTEGDSTISWNLISSGSAINQNVVANVQTTVDSGTGDFAVETRSSSLLYDGISNGVNLEYIPQTDGVKENIILTRPAEQYKYVFRFQLQGIGARLTDDNTIELFDLNNPETVKYTMPAPYMFDKTGAESNKVYYHLSDTPPDEEPAETDNDLDDTSSEETSSETDEEPTVVDTSSSEVNNAGSPESSESENYNASEESSLSSDTDSSSSEPEPDEVSEEFDEDITEEDQDETSTEPDNIPAESNGEYYLTIEADSDWINDPARVFPVVIDPVLKKYRTKKDYSDLGQFQCIRKDRVEQTGNDLFVGMKDKTEHRSYMQFKLPPMQPGDRISEAKLTLACTTKGTAHDIYAYAAPSKWDESRINWSNQPLYEDAYKSHRLVDYASSSNSTIFFDITKPIQRWYDNPDTNNGLGFISQTGTNDTYSTLQPLQSSSTPFLQITYRSVTGLESYWSTHSVDVGDAGTGTINDYTGLLTFVRQDVATAGNRMPISISHVYNSRNTSPDSSWGHNWSINYAQTLKVPVGETDISKYPYVYTDADGTKHYFKYTSSVKHFENGALKTSTGAKTSAYPTAKDEDGLGLYVVPVTNKTLKVTYPIKIVNKSGSTCMYFDKMGRLGMITDQNQKENASNSNEKEQNRILITYDNSIFRIVKPFTPPSINGRVDNNLKIYEADYSRISIFTDLESELDILLANVKETSFLQQTQSILSQVTMLFLNSPYSRANYLAATKFQEAQKALQYLLDNSVKTASTRTEYVTTAKTAIKSAITAVSGLESLQWQHLSSIQDAVGNTVHFEYDINGRATSFTNPTVDDGKVSFTYDEDGKLTNVTDTKNRTVTYEYDGDNLLVAAQDSNGYRVEYNYSEKRVSGVSEYKDSQKGQAYTIEYGEDNTTSYRFSGKDDELGNSDDLLNVYTFDKEGKTQSVYSKIVSKADIIGGASYTYNGGTGDAAKKIKESAVTGTVAVNLLKNHSFEYSDSWAKYSECALNDHTLAIDTSQKYIGAKSAYIYSRKTTHIAESGYEQEVTLEPGEYTLSGYVMAKTLTGNAFLSVKAGDETFTSEKITGTTDTSMNSGWMRISLTFSLKSRTTVKARFATDGGTGQVWFDCLQLEAGAVANQYNILENCSFELGDAADAPYQWTYSQSSSTIKGSVTSEASVNGSRSYKITGEVKAKKGISITPAISGTASYILSGWVKTSCAPLRSDRIYNLTITYKNSSGTTVSTVKTPFNPSTDGWSYFSANMPTGEWNNVTFKISFDKNIGELYIDSLQLIKSEVKTNTYSSTGRVTSYTNKNAKTSRAYNDFDLPLNETTPSGNTTTYTYDAATNDVTRATVSTGPDSYYTYDKYGNVIDQIIRESSPEYYTKTEYTENGNFTTSSTDTREGKTEYEYDTRKGILLSQTDPDSVTTEYSYNEYDQITGVSKAGVTNSYSYDSEQRLSKISHNGFEYSFDYDAWGNTLSVAAAGNTLTENIYAPGNGKLLQTSYANGYTSSPIYNEKEQIVGNQRNGVTVDKLAYNNTGHMVEYLDYINGLRYNYDYDDQGRALRQFVSQLDGSGRLYQFQNTYDAVGRISAVSYGFGDTRKSYRYTYAVDDKATKTTLPNSGSVAYTYDTLRRLSSSVLIPVSGAVAEKRLNVAVTYLAGVGSTEKKKGTTTLVEKYSNMLGFVQSSSSYGSNYISSTSTTPYEVSSYTYAYDVMGNITRVTDKSGKTVTYDYDQLSQLTRVNDEIAGKTTVYNYDSGGNLTSTVEYPYTIGELGEPSNTHNYRYDSSWKDLLVEYDGQSITYDAIGNPLFYLGSSLTWNGRQLDSIEKGDTQISYAYTPDGTRLSKMVNGVKTEYTLNGRTVLSETTGNETLYYYYDSNGQLVEIGYKKSDLEEVYYFVTQNAQGDITALYDAKTCALVGTYSYDAWGKLMSATAANDPNGITQKNPFRYRGYYYDNETGFYYLQSRYYDPETCRFISADTINNTVENSDDILSGNLFAYCTNNPVNHTDPDGAWKLPNWAKFTIGAVALAGAAALTVATGGALAPLLVAVAVSTVSGAAIGAVKGGVQGAVNGAYDGFMWGGIGALGGAAIGAAVAVSSAKKGVIIGEAMDGRVVPLAKQVGLSWYGGLKPYRIIEILAGEKIAQKIGLAHNKAWILRQMHLGAKIYDIGLGGTNSDNYAMELQATANYFNYVDLSNFKHYADYLEWLYA